MYMYTENLNLRVSKSTSSQKSKSVFSLYIGLPHAWLLNFSFSKNADKVVNFLKMHDKNC